MSKLFEELTALKKAYDEKLEKEGEAAVKELFKDFFDANPRAESVSWRQYTPYFNDGDPCYFSVHEFYLTLNSEGDEGEDDDDDDDEHDVWSLSESEDSELKKLGEELEKLEDIPGDVLEHVFGDHVRITATREGFDVDEYDHD